MERGDWRPADPILHFSSLSSHYVTAAFVHMATKRAMFTTQQYFDLLKAHTAEPDGLWLDQ